MNEDFITSSVPYEKVTDVAYDPEQDKSPEQKQIELEQAREDYNLAALSEHPGWQQIKADMKQDIEDFKTFKNVDMQKYTDKELGEVVRSERTVADKLQNYLDKIDNAVKAVGDRGRKE